MLPTSLELLVLRLQKAAGTTSPRWGAHLPMERSFSVEDTTANGGAPWETPASRSRSVGKSYTTLLPSSLPTCTAATRPMRLRSRTSRQALRASAGFWGSRSPRSCPHPCLPTQALSSVLSGHIWLDCVDHHGQTQEQVPSPGGADIQDTSEHTVCRKVASFSAILLPAVASTEMMGMTVIHMQRPGAVLSSTVAGALKLHQDARDAP